MQKIVASTLCGLVITLVILDYKATKTIDLNNLALSITSGLIGFMSASNDSNDDSFNIK